MRPPTPPYGRSRHIQGIGLQVGLKIFGEVQIECYRPHSDIRKLAFTPLSYQLLPGQARDYYNLYRNGSVLLFSIDLTKYVRPTRMTGKVSR